MEKLIYEAPSTQLVELDVDDVILASPTLGEDETPIDPVY